MILQTLLTLGITLVTLRMFFVGYCGTMGLKSRWRTLHWSAKVLCAPAVLLLVVFDVLVNLVSSILFMDWPNKWSETLSQRLGRYILGLEGPKRAAVAEFICKNWLDPFEPGHCS